MCRFRSLCSLDLAGFSDRLLGIWRCCCPLQPRVAPFTTWPTSRRYRRYWPKPASLPERPLDGATWRACAAACGLFVSAPFLRELHAGEEHNRRALRGPFSRLGRRRAHVGVLGPEQPVWGDVPRTRRRGAPVRQGAAFRSRIGFLQLADARLFAFLAAMAPRRWG
jgi:hypothetical protein